MNGRVVHVVLAVIAIVALAAILAIWGPREVKSKPHKVIIVEWYDNDAVKAYVTRVIDGDTIWVKLENGSKYRVRLVGYNAYELNEPLGQEARRLLERLLDRSAIYLDIDDYEPFDWYGRLLGYVWFRRNGAYCLLNKAMLLAYRHYVKNVIHKPPDEHPYWTMTKRHVIDISRYLPKGDFEVIIENCTGVYTLGKTTRVILTGGVYRVYVDGDLKGVINVLSPVGK